MQGLFVHSVTLPLDLSSPPNSLVVCTGLSFYLSYAHRAWGWQAAAVSLGNFTALPEGTPVVSAGL